MMTVKNHFSYSDFLIKWRRHNDCNDVVALCARLGDSGGGGEGVLVCVDVETYVMLNLGYYYIRVI